MKAAWLKLRENWQTMGIGQKFLWVITFPVMFPLLWWVVLMDPKMGKTFEKQKGRKWDKK